MTDRIQARAVRRCGELLKTFNSQGRREPIEGTRNKSMAEAATDAGMSHRQRATAVRVANVPGNDFGNAAAKIGEVAHVSHRQARDAG